MNSHYLLSSLSSRSSGFRLRRWVLAAVAYVSTVSASVGAAAALVGAGLPLDVLVAVV
ncbi:MAG: hypothetical protein Q7T70_07800 [Polaromonas sp.]|nr:hypothetical protein [Polaromonas sp.]